MYEMTDAILVDDFTELEGELGDLFLHLVFYCKIGSETNLFSVDSVLNRICDKLIERHPHIYGDTVVTDEEDVKRNWEKLKLKEGKKSVLQGVPKSLPALVKATRIQEKVKGIGFEWNTIEEVWSKVEEEMKELKVEIQCKSSAVEEEFGDLLFSLVNLSRYINVQPENALARTNSKFIKRFQLMENLIESDNLKLENMSLDEMDIYWEKAKNILKREI
jgi:XTP/dITP diphosphohydrolase